MVLSCVVGSGKLELGGVRYGKEFINGKEKTKEKGFALLSLSND